MKEKIKDFIVQELLGNNSDFEISMDEDILTTGTIDSLGVMQLITFLENNFETTINPEDMVIENFITINAIEDFINNNKS